MVCSKRISNPSNLEVRITVKWRQLRTRLHPKSNFHEGCFEGSTSTVRVLLTLIVQVSVVGVPSNVGLP